MANIYGNFVDKIISNGFDLETGFLEINLYLRAV